MILAAGIAIWIACAAVSAWLWAESWPNRGTRLDYAQGFAFGLLTGPIGIIAGFILFEPRSR